jgi:hypothetical protein
MWIVVNYIVETVYDWISVRVIREKMALNISLDSLFYKMLDLKEYGRKQGKSIVRVR